MHVLKFDFKAKRYKLYLLPLGAALIEPKGGMCNCAGCGRAMSFAEGYTSRAIHQQLGFGYCVCAACYDKELVAEGLKAEGLSRH